MLLWCIISRRLGKAAAHCTYRTDAKNVSIYHKSNQNTPKEQGQQLKLLHQGEPHTSQTKVYRCQQQEQRGTTLKLLHYTKQSTAWHKRTQTGASLGLMVRAQCRTDTASSPLHLTVLFKRCGSWSLSSGFDSLLMKC